MGSIAGLLQRVHFGVGEGIPAFEARVQFGSDGENRDSVSFLVVTPEELEELPIGGGELSSRVFLVGPNASGKSNLLVVFRFLRDLVSQGGGFQAAVERRHGVKALRCLAARRDSDIEIYVRVSPMDGSVAAPSWEYTLVFNQDSSRRPRIHKE
jgi:hypothetical protein